LSASCLNFVFKSFVWPPEYSIRNSTLCGLRTDVVRYCLIISYIIRKRTNIYYDFQRPKRIGTPGRRRRRRSVRNVHCHRRRYYYYYYPIFFSTKKRSTDKFHPLRYTTTNGNVARYLIFSPLHGFEQSFENESSKRQLPKTLRHFFTRLFPADPIQ